jgi:polyketide synthase PksL
MESAILKDCLMESYATNLLERFNYHVQNQPDKIAYRFIEPGLLDEKVITYRELWLEAGKVAAYIFANGYNNKKIMLCYESGLDFIITFLGCLFAQSTVILYPYLKSENPETVKLNVEAACQLAGAELTIASQLTLDALQLDRYCSIESILSHPAITFSNASYRNNLASHILFTSGTTSAPKLVLFTHEMLAYNLFYTGTTWGVDNNSIHLNWGFGFHSAGLMVGYLLPLYHGGTCVQLDASDFQMNPTIFPALVSQYKITHTSSANFAFEHLLKKSPSIPLFQRGTMVGGDPLQIATILDFYQRYSQHGFSFRCLQTAYGMTEATGLISTGEILPTPQYVMIDLHETKHSLVVVTRSGKLAADSQLPMDFSQGNKIILGCGKASCGTEVLILNESHQPTENIGDVYFHSPSLARGYLRGNDVLDDLTNHTLNYDGKDYFPTGDMGFFYQNEIYILGRSSETIRINNAIYFPLFIELIVCHNIPELKAGTQVAIINQGTVILLQEIAPRLYFQMTELEANIKFQVERNYGLQIDKVCFIKENSMPKIRTSGKTQRKLCLQRLLSSQLDLVETACIN